MVYNDINKQEGKDVFECIARCLSTTEKQQDLEFAQELQREKLLEDARDIALEMQQ